VRFACRTEQGYPQCISHGVFSSGLTRERKGAIAVPTDGAIRDLQQTECMRLALGEQCEGDGALEESFVFDISRRRSKQKN